MSKQKMQPYRAEFKERAVKLAVEYAQPVVQTARELGINENTWPTYPTITRGVTESLATSTPNILMKSSSA
jgi:hypothetical protein